MSFSSNVKHEIINNVDLQYHCFNANLLVYLNNYASYCQIANKTYLCFKLDNFLYSSRLYSILLNLFRCNIEVLIQKSSNSSKKTFYLLIKDQNVIDKILIISEIDIFEILEKECCVRSFLRENFILNGSISDPKKSYHLELVYSNYNIAKDISNIINSYNLNSKIINRKSNFVVYIKDVENILDFLNIIGAHKSLMDLENLRILKNISNNVNRKVNCETANLSKTINAAILQCENIRFIFQKKGFEYLSEPLENVAKLRLKYPEASLSEIGKMLNPPISKSGVNHRLRKINYIAERLRGKL